MKQRRPIRVLWSKEEPVAYEIISIENGDVLRRLDDRDEAVDVLVTYVEAHRPSHPGIEKQVAMIELDEDEQRRSVEMYEDLVRRASAAAH